MKRIFFCLNILLVSFTMTGCLAGRFLCNTALLPEEHGNDFAADRDKVESRYPGILSWYDGLYDKGVFKDTTLIGEGGFKLHGVYAPASDPANAKGTAVVVHGYTDNYICYIHLARMYRDNLNYNVMVPDLHYHGLSEGRAVQMGWLDRFDVMKFAEMAHDIWGDDFMVVHGVSMGGAIAMMLSGDDDLPPYLRAFVDDCGYTSVWDQLAHNLKDTYHLPPFPLLNSASIVCKNRYGWGFKEASSVDQLAKGDRPVLFIHGENDDFVPTEHVYKNYEAKTKGYKELWIAPGSKHAMSFKDHPEEYTQHVRDFLAKVKTL